MLRPTPITSFLVLLLIALFITRCSEDQIIEMKMLEQDLLLTWIALEREDSLRVTAYNDATQKDWLLLQSHGSPLKSPAIRQSAGRVNLWMLNLRNAVSYNQPERAIMAIHLMQNEFRKLHPQMGISHPTDHLYDFYYQWHGLVTASNDSTMFLQEWNVFEERYELAAQSWAAYVADPSRFSDPLFPGYSQNADSAEAAALAITRRLKNFATILEAADHTLAAEPSQLINDLFFDFLAIVTAYPAIVPSLETQNN